MGDGVLRFVFTERCYLLFLNELILLIVKVYFRVCNVYHLNIITLFSHGISLSKVSI